MIGKFSSTKCYFVPILLFRQYFIVYTWTAKLNLWQWSCQMLCLGLNKPPISVVWASQKRDCASLGNISTQLVGSAWLVGHRLLGWPEEVTVLLTCYTFQSAFGLIQIHTHAERDRHTDKLQLHICNIQRGGVVFFKKFRISLY